MKKKTRKLTCFLLYEFAHMKKGKCHSVGAYILCLSLSHIGREYSIFHSSQKKKYKQGISGGGREKNFQVKNV